MCTRLSSGSRRWLVASAMVISAACNDAAGPGHTCGDTSPRADCHVIAVGNTTRDYLLHVPPSFTRGTGALVIALHGVGQRAPRMETVSELNLTADANGFAIAYPNAAVVPSTGVHVWNAYYLQSRWAPGEAPDDIAFLRALVDRLRGELAPDPKRIYFVGLSNGGLMVHRVAVEMGDLVAAVADVAGTLASSRETPAVGPLQHPVSVLMLHGDTDPVVQCCPLKGSATMDDAFAFWSQANECANLSTTAPICTAPEVPSSLALKVASSCRANAEVRFYMLFGGQHGWYQGALNQAGEEAYNPFFDATTGITLNDVIWKWLAAHPKS